MKKGISYMLAAIIVFCTLQICASAANITADGGAGLSDTATGESEDPPGIEPADEEDDGSVSVVVNGWRADMQKRSYVENGVTFVPVREISMALGADSVMWDKAENKAVITAEGLTISAVRDADYIVANGRYLYVEGGCRVENGTMMLPVRILCKAFGAEVKWKAATRTVSVVTGGPPIEPGDTYYDGDDVYWLSRIISAEARGECFEGKIAVGNVIMNRIASPVFPDGVESVIFDRRYGVQFTPAYLGAVYYTPDQECIIAAKIALEGHKVVGNSLYFVGARYAASSWAGRNREYYAQLGNHVFFL